MPKPSFGEFQTEIGADGPAALGPRRIDGEDSTARPAHNWGGLHQIHPGSPKKPWEIMKIHDFY